MHRPIVPFGLVASQRSNGALIQHSGSMPSVNLPTSETFSSCFVAFALCDSLCPSIPFGCCISRGGQLEFRSTNMNATPSSGIVPSPRLRNFAHAFPSQPRTSSVRESASRLPCAAVGMEPAHLSVVKSDTWPFQCRTPCQFSIPARVTPPPAQISLTHAEACWLHAVT
ncbi:hypothetical protein C8R43DRAFT_603713 [Mycena crocata]|nr:hypothetical protein C8R43DRAFT_603713 [Mycena crocata]